MGRRGDGGRGDGGTTQYRMRWQAGNERVSNMSRASASETVASQYRLR